MRLTQVIWQDPAWHPTVRHTAQLVCERGGTVDLLCRYVPYERTFLGGVDFGTRTKLTFVGSFASGWRGRWEFLLFLVQVWRHVRSSRPDCVIGYDLHGALALLFLSYAQPHSLLVYHNFDLPLPAKTTRDRLASRLANRAARRADCVIVSSPARADSLRARAALGYRPLVVPNVQRATSYPVRTGELQRLLTSRGLHFDRLVVRAGQLSAGHGIEAAIRSIHQWQGHWGLILVGHPVSGYHAQLESLIAGEGLGARVAIIPNADPGLWDDCITSADVGIALYESGDANRESMAGAGNKLNIYMRAGAPSIVPTLPDFLELLERYPLGVPADPTSPDSIANAVNSLLENEGLYQRCAGAARRAFEEEYNFEHLFGPALDFLWWKTGEPASTTVMGAHGNSPHDPRTEPWLGQGSVE